MGVSLGHHIAKGFTMRSAQNKPDDTGGHNRWSKVLSIVAVVGIVLTLSVVLLGCAEKAPAADEDVPDSYLLRNQKWIEGFSTEDLEQFFFPRTYKNGMAIKDLPLSKIIIHRHGGKVDATMEGNRGLILRVVIPLKPPE